MATATATTTIHGGVTASSLMGPSPVPQQQSILHVDRINQLREKRSRLHQLRTTYSNTINNHSPISTCTNSNDNRVSMATELDGVDAAPTATFHEQQELAQPPSPTRPQHVTTTNTTAHNRELVKGTNENSISKTPTNAPPTITSASSWRTMDTSTKLEEYKRLSGLKKKRLQELKEESSSGLAISLPQPSTPYGAGLDLGRVSAHVPEAPSPTEVQSRNSVIGTSVVIHAKTTKSKNGTPPGGDALVDEWGETGLSSSDDDDFSSLSGMLDHFPQHLPWIKPQAAQAHRRAPNIFEDVNEESQMAMEPRGIPKVISFEACSDEELKQEREKRKSEQAALLTAGTKIVISPAHTRVSEEKSRNMDAFGGPRLARSRCLMYYGDKVDVLEADIQRLEIEKAELLGIVQNLRETVASCEYKVGTLEVEKARLRDINEITYSGMKQLLVEQNIESEKLRLQVEALEQTVEHTSTMNRIGFGVSTVLILGAAIFATKFYYLSEMNREELFDEGRTSEWFAF